MSISKQKLSTQEQNNSKEKNLLLAIDEQRNDYDVINSAYEALKVKNITFLGAAFGILLYLYGTTPSNLPLLQKLFIPKEPYGIVVYAMAALLFLVSIVLLLIALKPRRWSTAYDNEQEQTLLELDHVHYLEYMQRRYLRCARINSVSYQSKQNLVDIALPLMLAGAILLVVLKTFGG